MNRVVILSLVPCLTTKSDNSSEEGLFCSIWECVLKYQFENGLSFSLAESLAALFSHLKESIKRHS